MKIKDIEVGKDYYFLNNNGGIDTFKCIFNDEIVIRIQFVEYSSCGPKKIFYESHLNKIDCERYVINKN